MGKFEWVDIDPKNWGNAIYSGKVPIVFDVYKEELKFVDDIVSKGDSLIEIGCGLGHFLLEFINRVKYCIGIDISQDMLEVARKRAAEMGAEKNLFLINGDVVDSENLVRKNLPEDFWNSRKVVCCVLNTLGVMKSDVRVNVLKEMRKLVGSNGVFVLILFDKADFADRGINEFYRNVPELCGSFDTDSVDFENGELHTDNGYYSHWFSREEVQNILKELDLEGKIIKKGIGLFVVARPK